MFCPSCGTQIIDGTSVCPNCNNVVSVSPTQNPVSQFAPSQQPQQAQSVPTVPIGRMKYFWTDAAPKDKKKINIVALILGIICLLTVILSANRTINGSIYNVPFLRIANFINTLAEGDDYREYKEQIDYQMEHLEKALDAAEDDDLSWLSGYIQINLIGTPENSRYYSIINDIEGETGMSMKQFLKLFKPVSMSSTVKIAEILENQSESTMVIKIMIAAITVFAVIFLLLTACGVCFQKTWLMVLCYCLSFLFILLTGGLILWLVASVSYITCAVLFSKLKREYKRYLASVGV